MTSAPLPPAAMTPPGLLPGAPTHELQVLIDSLRAGSRRWALIFGAGLSRGAGLPDWAELTEQAAKAFGFAYPSGTLPANYPHALEQCEVSAPSRSDFWDLITNLVCRTGTPTAAQRYLAAMPFELFVSLNYDCLLESEIASLRGGVDVLAYPDIPRRRLGDGRIVYLHGRCPASGSLTPGETVLTRSTYDVAYQESSDLLFSLELIFRDFDLLFVGTSLSDPDIAHLLRTIERRARTHFGGAPRERLRFAIVGTPEVRYQENLELTFDGFAMNIRPIWYARPSAGAHTQLDVLLEHIARAVRP